MTPARLQRVHDGDIGPNDRWHDLGDFPSPEAAMTEAHRRFQLDNDYEIAFCGHCLA